jgi:hypothetical protein
VNAIKPAMSWRPRWADFAVDAVMVAGLVAVGHSVTTDPMGLMAFSSARPGEGGRCWRWSRVADRPGRGGGGPRDGVEPGVGAVAFAVVSTVTADTLSAGYQLTVRAGVTGLVQLLRKARVRSANSSRAGLSTSTRFSCSAWCTRSAVAVARARASEGFSDQPRASAATSSRVIAARG